MVRVSIISLIYKSSSFADWVYMSAQKYTPMLERGEAEFFFIANDPSEAVLNHLKARGYPYYLNVNKAYTNKELLSLGYGSPEYMSRVYRGYNEGILRARGEIVVLVNSDNFFSPDWLENLLKYLSRNTVVSSKLIEPKHHTHDTFEGAINLELGNTPANFREDEFISYVNKSKITGVTPGGAYMPCALYKDTALFAGLYPEGNLASKTFEKVDEYGDIKFFQKLDKLGVRHLTSLDSLVYHLKEGEKDDLGIEGGLVKAIYAEQKAVRKYSDQLSLYNIKSVIQPMPGHLRIIDQLLSGKVEKTKPTSSKTLVNGFGEALSIAGLKQLAYNFLVVTRLIGPVKKLMGKD